MVFSLVSTYIDLKFTYSKKKLHTSLDYWSRYILNFDFLEIGLGTVFLRYFVDGFPQSFSIYILLTDSISLFNCFYFLGYWAISALQLFISLVATLKILKLTSCFYSDRFSTWIKSEKENLDFLRMTRAFKVK